MNTFWVTFYSYKGGVGRTMALANVAALLAKQGRRVFLIDFDLEAPGLDAFDDLGCSNGHPGVVEYASEYLRTGKAPPLGDYVKECVPQYNTRGRIWLMPSGRKDHRYNHDRSNINWSDLYERFNGLHFIENWKADVEQTYAPDYVLIDSRTGLTDVGGICTLHFPQLVVLLYALNDQNIHGISHVARVIAKASTKGPLQILTVASPVPNLPTEKTGLLKQRLDLVEKKLGTPPNCQIHYDSRVSLKEQILVWDEVTTRVASEYLLLKDAIADRDPKGLDYFIKESRRAIEELNEERARAVCEDLKTEYGTRPETHYHVARTHRAFGPISEVEPRLRQAFSLDPLFDDAYQDLISLLKSKRRFSDCIDICRTRLAALGNESKSTTTIVALADLGSAAMAIKDYPIAIDAFFRIKNTNGLCSVLAAEFNLAEARRRNGERLSIDQLDKIINLFEHRAATEDAGLVVTRINQMQAMHIAYALRGEIDQAVHLLTRVYDLANTVSRRERIFSVVDYTEVPMDQILEQNEIMLNALKHGQLWDGTPLDTA